jgi:hypothetical protein
MLAVCVSLAAVAGASSTAHAFCNPNVNYQRIVGAVGDADCTDNTIQSAIDHVICPNTTIYVTQPPPGQSYSAQHLLIQDLSLSIVGSSSATCGVGNQRPVAAGSAPTTPVITISGAGHSGDSVISIHGNSNVTLQYLDITSGASDQDQYGGGIYFGGSGSLTLDTDTVENNYAGHGGGIYFNGSGTLVLTSVNVENNRAHTGAGIAMTGSGTGASLSIHPGAVIESNSADGDGGGIEIDGNARLYMVENNSLIAFNNAGGHGGGLDIVGPARADIGSPGIGGSGAVLDNAAAYGGGIAAFGSGSGNGTARLFSTDPMHPVLMSLNSASVEGGAVYLQSSVSGGTATGGQFCAFDFRIDTNTAPEGAVIYADFDGNDFGVEIYFNPGGSCGPEPISSLGAVICAPGVPCNEISNNAALDNNDVPVGSIIATDHIYEFAANRIVMRGNNAAHIISFNYGVEGSTLNNCLIVDNHSVHELVHEIGGVLQVDNCTFAQNAIDEGFVFFSTRYFELLRSIVYQPGHETIDYESGGCTADCIAVDYVMTNDAAAFPAGSENVLAVADPLFVDPANANPDQRDYHLLAYTQNGLLKRSTAIDFSPSQADFSPPFADDGANDFDGKPRDQDVPAAPNLLGPRDLGAYEMQPIVDRVFADGFGDRISLVH